MPQLKGCLTCGGWIPAGGPPRCAEHSTPPAGDTSWNGNRDRDTQRRFRRMLIERDGLRCRDCGAVDVPLDAHHDTATDGRLLCQDCHIANDPHARRTR